MAKTNGWPTVVQTTPSNAVPIYSKYTRYTELRLVDDNDIYNLAIILDRLDRWQKLMSIIPKRMDAKACSSGAHDFKGIADKEGLKYTQHHISLIAAERLKPGQSISQIMIEEWKTSGKFNERPTVGVLLQLLIQAEIYNAADYVAIHFLNEQPPIRPNAGPAAAIDFQLDNLEQNVEMDVDENTSFQPNTSQLHAAAAQLRTSKMNMDYYEKHVVRRDKSMPQGNGASKPVAPPRSKRTGVISKETTTATTNSSNSNSNNATCNTDHTSNAASTSNYIPDLSFFNMKSVQIATTNEPPQIPNLSLLNGIHVETPSSSSSSNNVSKSAATTTTTSPNLPLIRRLIESSTEISTSVGGSSSSSTTTRTTTNTAATATTAAELTDMSNLPVLSALNAADDNSSNTNSLSNDDEEEDEDDDDDDDDDDDVDDEEADVSLPNLSNSDHQTSNNESSLTTVTGTSGENSFELTNDSSSVSNDDYTNNIPNLSELQQ